MQTMDETSTDKSASGYVIDIKSKKYKLVHFLAESRMENGNGLLDLGLCFGPVQWLPGHHLSGNPEETPGQEIHPHLIPHKNHNFLHEFLSALINCDNMLIDEGSRWCHGSCFQCLHWAKLTPADCSHLKEKFAKRWKFIIYHPLCQWKVGWSFFVHKTFMELHRKTAFSWTAEEAGRLFWNVQKYNQMSRLLWQNPKCLEALRAHVDSKKMFKTATKLTSM